MGEREGKVNNSVPRTVEVVTTRSQMEAVWRIRFAVFTQEQGIPQTVERDGSDCSATHFLIREQEQYIATARLRQYAEHNTKLERMAVLADYRGQGVGRFLMQSIETEAARRGIRHILLHAQKAAQPFYLRLGYLTQGEPFLEAGVEHVTMTKKLHAPAGF